MTLALNAEAVRISIPEGLTIEQEEEFTLEWEIGNREAVEQDYFYRCEQRRAYTALKKSGPVSKHFEERIKIYDSIDKSIIQEMGACGFFEQIDNLHGLIINEKPLPKLTPKVENWISYLKDLIFLGSPLLEGIEAKELDSKLGDIIEEYDYAQAMEENAGQVEENKNAQVINKEEKTLIDTYRTVLKNKTLPLTDSGNAERLVRDHGDIIRYCHAFKSWMVYNGKYWQLDDTGEIYRLAKNTVREILREASRVEDRDKREQLIKWSRSSESKKRLGDMIALAQNEVGIFVKPHDFDRKPWLLNFENGTLCLRMGVLQPHNKEDFISKVIPISYDQKAECPLWLKFLDRSFDNKKEVIEFVQRGIGYTLTGITCEQCLFFLLGPGANGKTTFLNTIRTLMGEYGQQTDFLTFTSAMNDRIRNDLARLAGSRIVVATEVEEDRRLSEVVLKQVTGGEPITARFLYKEFFEFTPSFKIWLGMNHLPIIRGRDHAIWRRIHLINFDNIIPKNEQDKNLQQQLKAELPGILNWALLGCQAWQNKGLSIPQEVEDATDDYRHRMDNVSRFIKQYCIVQPSAKISLGELYEAYVRWFKDGMGEGEIVGKKKFNEQVEGLGYQRDKQRYKDVSSANVWIGLGLLTNETSADQHDNSVLSAPTVH